MQRSHPRSPYCLHRSPCCLAKVPESSIPCAFVKNAKEPPSESRLSLPKSLLFRQSPCCVTKILDPTRLCKKCKAATLRVSTVFTEVPVVSPKSLSPRSHMPLSKMQRSHPWSLNSLCRSPCCFAGALLSCQSA